jgi:adenosylcobinamide-phosphate synthase
MGRLIARCESAWNRPDLSFSRRRRNGVLGLLLWVAVAIAASIAAAALIELFLPGPLAMVLLGILASTLVAQRSLYQHVRAVAVALEAGDIARSRGAVAQIVGRDTELLPATAVARAAIESLAENFSDGVVAPVFWMVVGGLPGAAFYKAVNTADSMVGHKSERYRAFGWASARLDDFINLPASRLAAGFLVAAAAVLPDASAREALQAVRRDAVRHRSPNAGWPEAAVAGALGLKLAGPRIYGGVLVGDAWMGHGRSEADAQDVQRALRLFRVACLIEAATVAAIALAFSF